MKVLRRGPDGVIIGFFPLFHLVHAFSFLFSFLTSFRSILAEIATGTDCNVSGWIDNVTRVFPPLESWTHLVQESSGELGLSAKLAWVLGKRIRYKWFLTGEGIGH